MDIKTLDNFVDTMWGEFAEIYPALVRFNPPTIILNNRFTRTAGQCHQTDNYIQLANKFFIRNEAAMLSVILPHELAHQVDYNLFGDSEKKCGHGVNWEKIMLQYGLPANKYHSLEI
jgi:predicted SprT family Zn-dependent metalloprotease